jgi:hypothetical protein
LPAVDQVFDDPLIVCRWLGVGEGVVDILLGDHEEDGCVLELLCGNGRRFKVLHHQLGASHQRDVPCRLVSWESTKGQILAAVQGPSPLRYRHGMPEPTDNSAAHLDGLCLL